MQTIHRVRTQQRHLWVFQQLSSAQRKVAPRHVPVVVKQRSH